MFWEFVATVSMAFAAAGVVLLLNRLLGGRLPRWLTPVAAGLAMLGFTIWMEYSWLSRTLGTLPDEVVVASTNETRAAYRPWTYLVPLTTRFSAVDHGATMRHPQHPEMLLTSVLLLGRWEAGYDIRVMFDCADNRRADLLRGAAFAEDGTLENAEWRDLPADDPLLRAACDGV